MSDRGSGTRTQRAHAIRRSPKGRRRPGGAPLRTGPPTASPVAPPGDWEREQEHEQAARDIDRLVFFSDAVIAIAITLLVLKIELPEDWAAGGRSLGDAIGDLAGNIVVFFWSFMIVGTFWMRHRQVFRNIVRLTNRLVVLNVVFLALIALVPFPADVLGRTGISWVSVSLFAATITAAGIVLTLIWIAAYRDRRLVESDRSDEELVREGVEIASLPAVFLLALIIAPISPTVATWCWVLLALNRPLKVVARWLTPLLMRSSASPAASRGR